MRVALILGYLPFKLTTELTMQQQVGERRGGGGSSFYTVPARRPLPALPAPLYLDKFAARETLVNWRDVF